MNKSFINLQSTSLCVFFVCALNGKYNSFVRMFRSVFNCSTAASIVPQRRQLFHSGVNCSTASSIVPQRRQMFRSGVNCSTAASIVPQQRQLFRSAFKSSLQGSNLFTISFFCSCAYVRLYPPPECLVIVNSFLIHYQTFCA